MLVPLAGRLWQQCIKAFALKTMQFLSGSHLILDLVHIQDRDAFVARHKRIERVIELRLNVNAPQMRHFFHKSKKERFGKNKL